MFNINLSNDSKEKYRNILFGIILVLICIWGIMTGIQMLLECYMLDINASNVKDDIKNGSLVEVSTVYENEDFYLEGVKTKYTKNDIKSYIRVPEGGKYYYNIKNKSFVAPLNSKESRDEILQFFVLDTVIFFIGLYLVLFRGDVKRAKFWLYSLLFIVYCIIGYLVYNYSITVLYGGGISSSLITSIKLFILAICLIVKQSYLFWKHV